jgi:hypothetical protein
VVDVAIEKIMPQLMGDAEPLKTLARDVRGIEDSKTSPCRSSMPETPPAVSGFGLTSISWLAAMAKGSTGKVAIPCSRKSASAFCLAILSRNA